MMASSPTPSLESLPFGETNDYLSDSPLTLSGSSPPISDPIILVNNCDDFNNTATQLTTNNLIEQKTNNFLNSGNIIGNGIVSGILDIYPRCTGCKNKQSDAVAKCIDCINYLCAQCVTAHQRMHCFDGHNVYRINDLQQLQQQHNNYQNIIGTNNTKMLNGFDQTIGNNRLNIKDDLISKSIMSNLLNTNDQQQQHQQSSPSPPMITTTSSSSSSSTIITNTTSQQLINNNNNKSQLFQDIISGGIVSGINNRNGSKSYFCQRHENELLKFYCRTCTITVCKECIQNEHQNGLHDCEQITNPLLNQLENLMQVLSDVKLKLNDIRLLNKNLEHNQGRIQIQYHKAQNEINDTYEFYKSMIDERKEELLKDLENLLNTTNMYQNILLTRSQEQIKKVLDSCECVEKVKHLTNLQETTQLKKLMENKLQTLLPFINDLQSTFDLDFISNYKSIQVGVRNTFGYIRSDVPVKQPPIARPTITTSPSSILSSASSTIMTQSLNNQLISSTTNQQHQHQQQQQHCNGSNINNCNNLLTNGSSTSSSSSGSLNNQLIINNIGINNGGCHSSSSSSSVIIERPYSNGHNHNNHQQQQPQSSPFESNIISKRFNSGGNNLGPFVNDVNIHINPYEKWSNGGDNNLFNHITDQYTNTNNQLINQQQQQQSTINNDTIINDLTSKLMISSSSSSTIFPPKSQIKRQKMIYHCKFGEFGVMEGQFTEPSGVAVNAQNDIIVADTNNHRIQIFDKEGRFKFQFGECGKRDGQLLYPNRVAVVRTSGDIIVTERSPTHQIQIYNQYGQFVRKFGANILQHPRGVTVDNKGRIIVVECKVMRVIIFDQSGNVIHKFGCSKHLEFPNGVVVNDKQEIFISDNRAHCVKVFSYDGIYLRQIGGEGITNYPIGVGINITGEILIADNHNNFNLTIFTQDGQLVSALESKVKHAQCFDVALMDDGSVVLASKDYRLYIYRYIQVPQI